MAGIGTTACLHTEKYALGKVLLDQIDIVLVKSSEINVFFFT